MAAGDFEDADPLVLINCGLKNGLSLSRAEMMERTEQSSESHELGWRVAGVDRLRQEFHPASSLCKGAFEGYEIWELVGKNYFDLFISPITNMFIKPGPRTAATRTQVDYTTCSGFVNSVIQSTNDGSIHTTEIENSLQTVGHRIPQKIREPGLLMNFDEAGVRCGDANVAAQALSKLHEDNVDGRDAEKNCQKG